MGSQPLSLRRAQPYVSWAPDDYMGHQPHDGCTPLLENPRLLRNPSHTLRAVLTKTGENP
jgi:hypothetical protein